MTLRSHVNYTYWHVNGVSGCPDEHDLDMIVVMYVVRVPNRGSPPAILLRESYREDGKVKNRTLANLSSWPEAKVDALTRVLKGQPPPAAPLAGAFEITRSLPHGHVAAVLGTARQLGLEEPDRPGAVPAPGPGDRDGGRAGARAGLQAGDRPRAPGGDRGQLPGRAPRAGLLR